MAIRLADTTRPNNYVDSEHLGSFPVAYAEDIWFEDGTRLSEKTFSGDSIQVDELPLASATEEGNVYQYLGSSGTYEHGCFYECVDTRGSGYAYSWKLLNTTISSIVCYSDDLYKSSFDDGSVVCYTGDNLDYLNRGSIYEKETRQETIYEYHAYADISTFSYWFFKEKREVRVGDIVFGENINEVTGDVTYKPYGYIVSISGDDTTIQLFKRSITETRRNPIYEKDINNADIIDWWEISGGENLEPIDEIVNESLEPSTSNAVYNFDYRGKDLTPSSDFLTMSAVAGNNWSETVNSVLDIALILGKRRSVYILLPVADSQTAASKGIIPSYHSGHGGVLHIVTGVHDDSGRGYMEYFPDNVNYSVEFGATDNWGSKPWNWKLNYNNLNTYINPVSTSTSTTFSKNHAYKMGRIAMLQLGFSVPTGTPITSGYYPVGTITEELKPLTDLYIPLAEDNTTTPTIAPLLWIDTNGNVKVRAVGATDVRGKDLKVTHTYFTL